MKKKVKKQIIFTLIDNKVQTDISDDLIALQIPFAELRKAVEAIRKVFAEYNRWEQ